MNLTLPLSQRLPHDVEIEREVLGAVLLANLPALPDLSVDDFALIEHQAIWREIEAVAATGARPDAILVGGRLVESASFASPEDTRQLIAALVGGSAGLTSQAPHYAERLRELARRRRQIDIADRLRAAAQAGEDTTALVGELTSLRSLAATWPYADFDVVRCAAGDPLEATDFLVEGLIPDMSIVGLVGGFGTLKTFIGVSVICCVATGKPFFGRPIVRRSPGLIVAGEGARGIDKRVKAWAIKNGVKIDVLPVYRSTTGGRLSDPAFLDRLDQKISEIADAEGAVPNIMIDTTATNFGLEKESNEEFSAVIREQRRRIVDRHGAVVINVHHHGKDSARGARGGVSFTADSDCQFETEVIRGYLKSREKATVANDNGAEGEKPAGPADKERKPFEVVEDAIRLRCTKPPRDGEKPEDMLLKAELVEIGTNKRGATVTSLALAMGLSADDHKIIGLLREGVSINQIAARTAVPRITVQRRRQTFEAMGIRL